MDNPKPQNPGGDQPAESDLRAVDPKLSRAIELNDLIERRNAEAAQRIDEIEHRISRVQGQLDSDGEPEHGQLPDVAQSRSKATRKKSRCSKVK